MHSPWIRTKELHDSHVTSAQENGASCFGVKRHCVITKTLAHFSVQTGYPPDIMHDLFEGIVPVELALRLALYPRSISVFKPSTNPSCTSLTSGQTRQIGHM